jgi:hypothetical protein
MPARLARRARLARLTAAGMLGCAAFFQVFPVAAAGPAWQPLARVAGIFDIGGPRQDGWLVVAGAGRLWLVDPQGAVTPFAQGPGGYADDKGGEPYLAVSPGLHLDSPGCDFAPGDVYILRLHAPLGVTRVDAEGQKSSFANVPGVSTLNGIAFDTVGDFGHRLLVTGPAGGGKTQVAAVNCSGAVQVLTRTAPPMEGGMAVAPLGFGGFAGELIAPDEYSGNIYAVGSNGSASLVARSGLPKGGDIGVESVAFVPPGFSKGGTIFYADRATPGSPHPGTDSLLKMPAAEVTPAGVHEGDLFAVTEGGATAIDVSCISSCSVVPILTQATRAHGEGHVMFTAPTLVATGSPRPTAGATPPAKSGPQSPAAFLAIVIVVAVLGAGTLAVLRSRWR